ncbi:MAG: hypothetical protein QNJ32_28180 [Xenococcaceae cyanobacterium MO_167.B27]|nr:hypothetical protein [Xenococcaceae cyanobacterium MO_167.B27]
MRDFITVSPAGQGFQTVIVDMYGGSSASSPKVVVGWHYSPINIVSESKGKITAIAFAIPTLIVIVVGLILGR